MDAGLSMIQWYFYFYFTFTCECYLWMGHDKLNPGLMIILSAAARSAPIYHNSDISSGHSNTQNNNLKIHQSHFDPCRVDNWNLSSLRFQSFLANQPGEAWKMLSISWNSPKEAPRAVYWKCSHDYWLPMTGPCFCLTHNQQPVTGSLSFYPQVARWHFVIDNFCLVPNN